ncbi:uncharacterized protein BKA55DRAFT_686331 [Fusarium redolens]|uniref:Uncharacterized protein n=1 Tax=Fusarium redolens TaxID=48865 RepID=A0A9P9HNG4_FUSRE|nr:uncharacterized protein BKA55DRAFT_686331 [Fusarium redolens]KAH7260750.1 hypothetical protein BKA55DRAFT_686331 [Fusarium redolens]
MAAHKISDERFAEIRKAVGPPFAVPPSEYMRNLEVETKKDNSLTKFLERASTVDTESPRLSPKKWLEQLTIVDFSDHVAISDHRFGLGTDFFGKFDLVTDDMNTFAIAPYPGALSTEELPLPQHSSSPDTSFDDNDPHPSLLSLQIGGQHAIHPALETPTTVIPSVSGQPLPSLVLPVGKLQKRSNAKTNNVFLDTDYVLVIDAVATEHPVWLIYDRNPRDDLGERCSVDPDQQPLVFKGVGKNFDAAQVFPGIQYWIKSYGNLDFTGFQEAVKKTGIIAPVKATELTLSDAAKLFQQ